MNRLARYDRLFLCSKGVWLTSLEQAMRLPTTTISKVRHECKTHGYLVLSRKRGKLTEYKIELERRNRPR